MNLKADSPFYEAAFNAETGWQTHYLPDMNQIGLSEQHEELRRLSQQIDFLNGKARGEAKRKKAYFQLLRRVRRLRKRLLPASARRAASVASTFHNVALSIRAK